MKRCPKCNCDNISKDGFMNHKQRFTCSMCKYHFTRKQLELGKNNKPKLIKQAIQLHLENVSFRGIGRVLEVNYQTVINWLKSEADKITMKDFEVKESTVTELDEMHSYLGKKR